MDRIAINGNIYQAKIALLPEEQEMGLMYQDNPEILAFPFATLAVRSFWMKNTPTPLCILFCQENKIASIQYGEPHSLELLPGQCDLVIELPIKIASKIVPEVDQSVQIFCGLSSLLRKFH